MDERVPFHTIAICTARGVPSLSGTLPQLCRCLTPTVPAEILVIYNQSDGDVERVQSYVQRVCGEYSVMCSVVHEAAAGIANARNRALDVARGEIMSFLDDDTAPCDSRWQPAMLEAFTFDARIAMVGGPVMLRLPRSVDPRPTWYSGRVEQLLGCYGRDQASGYYGACGVNSGNASYRLAAIRQAVGLRFCLALGAGWSNGSKGAVGGEETLFNLMLEDCGHRAWFAERAAVHHYIDSARWKPRWLLTRARALGRTIEVVSRMHTIPGDRRGHPLRYGARVLMGLVKCISAVCIGRIDRAFSSLCDAEVSVGRLEAAIQRRGSAAMEGP